MSWWSWAIVGYLGLAVSFWVGVVGVCVAARLTARVHGRRLICEAERFLAEVALSVGNPSGSV